MVMENTLLSYQCSTGERVKVSVVYGSRLGMIPEEVTGCHDRDTGRRYPVHQVNVYSDGDLCDTIEIGNGHILPAMVGKLGELERACAGPDEVLAVLDSLADSGTIRVHARD